MLLAIRHLPDKKRPCIVLEDEQTGQILMLGCLTNEKREKWLRKATMIENPTWGLSIQIDSPYDLNEIIESEE